MNKYLSIITLNGLNAPIKRHRVPEWIRKHNLYIWSPQETHIRKKEQAESKGLEKLLQTNGQEKTSLVSNTYIRQNRLQNKGHKKRPRRTP